MRTFALIVAATVVLTVTAGAQQKPPTSPTPKPAASPSPDSKPKPRPNFSGRWTVISGEGIGQVEIVTQDARTLTTEHGSEGGSHKMTYQLDGIERRMAIPNHPEITWLAAASWDGDRIVITTKASYSNNMKTESKEVWSIDEKGQRVVDYTESSSTGSGRQQKVIYAKK